MTMDPYPTSRPSPVPVLLAVVVSVAALGHLVFGTATPQRTLLAVIAVVAGLLVGVLGVREPTPRVALAVLALTGVGAALLLGATYL